MNILNEIASYAKRRVEEDKKNISLKTLKDSCLEMGKGENSFYKSLKGDGLKFICEVKKASPSKGVISEEFPYMEIAREYEQSGADCISCLTEPHWFMGSDRIFAEIRSEVSIPMLRKDFTVDEYQIYQARLMGADAVLLICAISSAEQLKNYLRICENLGMDALVETHDEDEIKLAVDAGARIIGVNNRNLKDFSVDIGNTGNLRAAVPKECIYVAESGVKDENDVAMLKKAGADAILIGEAFMRSADKAAMLKRFRSA